MARPKTKKRLPVNVPFDLLERFDGARRVTGETQTQAVETAIRRYVELVESRGEGDLGASPDPNAEP